MIEKKRVIGVAEILGFVVKISSENAVQFKVCALINAAAPQHQHSGVTRLAPL